MNPKRKRRWLQRLLVIIGVSAILASVAVVLPHSVLNRSALWLGVGPLHDTPLIGYLTRTLSMMYVIVGVLFLYASADVSAKSGMISVLGTLAVCSGIVTLVITAVEGMPLWWTAIDGPVFAILGVALLLLNRPPSAN